MATTSLWRIKGPIGKVLNYASNEEKTVSSRDFLDDVISYAGRDEATDVKKYVSGINCEPEHAKSQMENVKKQFFKLGGTIAYHGYQSFSEGEVTPKQAHDIGIKLAEELWGDRFQVLVATHLDKASHIHNHFVINTVSFVDGGKFHRTKEDYRKMQEVSDRLCREEGLSVIEEKEDRSKHYAEWKAENEGRRTKRSMIRSDIDRCIKISATGAQFFRAMEKLGYEAKLYASDGDLLRHPAVKPPDSDRFFRLDSLGDGYSLDDIKRRVYANRDFRSPFEQPVKRKRTYAPRPKRKLHGIYALYIRYCYELHIIEKHPRPKKLSSFLREDLASMEKLDAQVRFMGRYGLKTDEDVKLQKKASQSLMESLTEERRVLRNSQRTLRKRGDEEGVQSAAEEINERTRHLGILRKEIALCDEILERAGDIRARETLAREYVFDKKENAALVQKDRSVRPYHR